MTSAVRLRAKTRQRLQCVVVIGRALPSQGHVPCSRDHAYYGRAAILKWMEGAPAHLLLRVAGGLPQQGASSTLPERASRADVDTVLLNASE